MMQNDKKKPNVVLFFTDQQRWDSSGLYGNPLDLMPCFDEMAKKGTHFYNTFTCQPLCGPARACLQTGKLPAHNGVFQNGLPLRQDEECLAKWFGAAGYKTGYIGKWHLGGVDPGFSGGQLPVPKERRGGFDYWLGADLPEFISDEYHAVLFDNENRKRNLPGYRADAYTDAAIRYIDASKDDPFFLCVSYLEPHFQNHNDNFPAPSGYSEKYTGKWLPPDLAALGGNAHQSIGGYYGMIKRLDECLGRILDALKSLKILDNTIVLFVSDHGCHFKTRNSEYKRSCHESSIRIPFAAQGPGFEHGGRITNLVSIIDIAPTLLDAAGIPIPEGLDGRSVLPIIRRESEEWDDEIYIEISETQIGRALRTKRWKYSVSDLKHSGIPFSTEYTEECLFDLEADPYELNNLIGMEGYRDIAKKLRNRLIERIEQTGEPKPQILEAPIWRDPVAHRDPHPYWKDE